MAKTPVLGLGDAGKLLAESAGMYEEDALNLAKTAELDRFIADPDTLWRKTGSDAEKSEQASNALASYMAKDPKAPLYRGKPGHEKNAGRQCCLYSRHMLLMCLERMRHATPRPILGDVYGISQSRVSRYADYVEGVLAKTLPPETTSAIGCKAARSSRSSQCSQTPWQISKRRPTPISDQPASRARRCRTTGSYAMARTSRGSQHAQHNALALVQADLGLATRCLEGKSRAMQCYEYGTRDSRACRATTPEAW